jgi:hypothetical protein
LKKLGEGSWEREVGRGKRGEGSLKMGVLKIED